MTETTQTILIITSCIASMAALYLAIFKCVWRKELEQTVADLLNQVVEIIKLKERTQRFISKLKHTEEK